MRLHSALAFAAFVVHFSASQALAIPPEDFCEETPTSPLCEPLDPCEENPELCEPIDPCELDPASCEPIDPCELDPASCEPVDPCELDPGSCEPTDPCEIDPASCEPEPANHGSLSGTARVRGSGFSQSLDLGAELYFDDATFSLMETGGCTIFTGNLAPKGKKGNKLQLFLDDASADAYTAFVAQSAAAASGRATGSPLGESAKLILKLKQDGTASLRIKSEVLFDTAGEVAFKARLSGPVTTGAVPKTGARCL